MEHLEKQIELMVDRIEKEIDKWENTTLRFEHVQRTSRRLTCRLFENRCVESALKVISC